MTRSPWSARKKAAAAAALVSLSAGLFFLCTHHTRHEASHESLTVPSSDSVKTTLQKQAQAELPWQTVTVQKGDTLSHLFKRLEIKPSELYRLTSSPKQPLRILHPGEKLAFQINAEQEIISLKVPIDMAKTLVVKRSNDSFTTTVAQEPTTRTLAFKSGTIKHSLAQTAKQSGLSPTMLMQLQNIFAGSINFNRDVRQGDSFALLYEIYYVNGKPYRIGNIVAADFINRGKTYRAVRYTYPKNHSGYYTADGHNVASRFLTTPVKYKRVSSHFSYHRLDPVTHRVHSHLGVDLAAPYGTPIKSIGDGIVIFRGPNAGYGNAVKVRYGTHYTTLYAHLSRFAKNLKVHQHVKKGQVIGYVGATGWATGPHLHFGIFVDGIAKDWLKLKPPKADPIPRSYQARFAETSKKLLAALSLRESTQTELASNQSNTHVK